MAKGYDISVNEVRDGIKQISLKKDGSEIKILSMDGDIASTTYSFKNGKDIRVSHTGSMNFTDSEGNSNRLYADDYGDNNIKSLLGNDSLLSLSKGERDDFLKSISLSDKSAVKTESRFTNNSDGSISQTSSKIVSGKEVKSIMTKARVDTANNTITFWQGEKKITLPVTYSERWGDPSIDSGEMDIPTSLEDEVLKNFRLN